MKIYLLRYSDRSIKYCMANSFSECISKCEHSDCNILLSIELLPANPVG